MATVPIHNVPNQSTDLATSIAINEQGVLCAAWKGNRKESISLIFNTDHRFPNWTWNDCLTLPKERTKHAPAIAFYGNRLYIAWISSDRNNNVCYTFTDDLGKNFGPTIVLQNTNAKTSPVLTAGQSMFFSYTDKNGLLNVMSVA